MKLVLAASCFALAGAVALAAQPPAQQPPKDTAPAVGQEKTVTVTGCLRAGDQSNTFVLENAKPDVPKGEKTTGTTGSPAIAEGSTLRIMGAPAKLDLKAHVGHTVQLTGMIVPQGKGQETPPATTPPPTPPQPTTPPAPTTGQADTMRRLNVSAMKHVSEKCPM